MKIRFGLPLSLILIQIVLIVINVVTHSYTWFITFLPTYFIITVLIIYISIIRSVGGLKGIQNLLDGEMKSE